MDRHKGSSLPVRRTSKPAREPKGSLLDYYLQHGISPVCYLAKDLSEHLERRQSLYNMLGLPGILFRNAKVLEIAAGSGQNSLYVSAQQPARYVIVEPNPVALKQIEETYRNFRAPHTCPEIIPVKLENYSPNELFDVVICEGWLGSSDHERSLVGTLADRVAPGGILILTALSISGWLPNLIRYCIVQKLLANQPEDYDSRVTLVQKALAPHLKTISGMTRRHEDWVKDNMVNPTYLDQGLTLEMILHVASARGFTVFGSSPDFITEWRWFKQLYGSNIRTNENALGCYEHNSHNFLDYRRTFDGRSLALNRQLNQLSTALLAALSKPKSSDKFNRAYFCGIVQILRRIGKNLKSVSTDLSAAIDEAIHLLNAPDVSSSAVSTMKHYKSWFGRETLYFSFVRAHNLPVAKQPNEY